MRLEFCSQAWDEFFALPPKEQDSMLAAFEKLELLGSRLAAPHSSAVKGIGVTLRELRPRAGRSPWRALYRRIGEVMVIGAIGPEAQANRRGVQRAVALAIERLDSYESERDNDEQR